MSFSRNFWYAIPNGSNVCVEADLLFSLYKGNVGCKVWMEVVPFLVPVYGIPRTLSNLKH